MSKRLKAVFAVAAVVTGMAMASSSEASIIVKSTRTTVTGGGDSLFDVIRFYAQIVPGGSETTQGATGLSAAAITMTADQAFKFGFVDRTGDQLPDWDPIRISPVSGGLAASPLTDNNNVNTIVAVRPYDAPAANQGGSISIPSGLYAIYPTPNVGDGKAPPQDSQDNDGDQTVSPGDFDPRTIYQSPLVAGFQTSPGLKTFRVEMFNSAVDPSALPGNANYTRGVNNRGDDYGGAMFAIAVVPHLTTVNINGSLAADKGDQQAVNFTDAVPEPGSVALIGAVGLGLLGRRRRKA